MKKRINTFAIALLAIAAVVSCAKNDNQTPTGTISVNVPGIIDDYSSDDVRSSAATVVRVAWTSEDKVYAYDGVSLLGTLDVTVTDSDKYATISGSIQAPASGTSKITLIHSNYLTQAPAVNGGKISVDISVQDKADFPFVVFGTLDVTDGQTAITSTVVPFTFATSVVKANCTGLRVDKSGAAIPATRAEIGDVNTVCELTLSSDAAPAVAGSTPGKIVRTNAFASQADSRIAFQFAVAETASTVVERTIAIYYGEGENYNISTFSSSALASGKSFNTVYEMSEKQPEELPYVIIGKLKWYKENLAITESGKAQWKTSGHIVGDYFQWGTYPGFAGQVSDPDKGLVIYSSFTTSAFTYKDPSKIFNKSTYGPWYSSGYTEYTTVGNVLAPGHDAARQILGGEWRIPSAKDFNDLTDNTTWAFDATQKGWYVYDKSDTGKENPLLFFPLAGYGNIDGTLVSSGTGAVYWRNFVPSQDAPQRGGSVWLGNGSGNNFTTATMWRSAGCSIRPVADAPVQTSTSAGTLGETVTPIK